MLTALTERPTRRLGEWTEDLDLALGVRADEVDWEPLAPAPYLLAPPPWPRGAFVIDPEFRAEPP